MGRLPPDVEDLATRAASRTDDGLYFNATAVRLVQAGLLILGDPGSGKSSLALQLLGMGARLISDDGVYLTLEDSGLTLIRPETAPPLIEARGIGLLGAGPIANTATLCLLVDLDRAEPNRLPPQRRMVWKAIETPLVLGKDNPGLAAGVAQMLRFGRARN